MKSVHIRNDSLSEISSIYFVSTESDTQKHRSCQRPDVPFYPQLCSWGNPLCLIASIIVFRVYLGACFVYMNNSSILSINLYVEHTVPNSL